MRYRLMIDCERVIRRCKVLARQLIWPVLLVLPLHATDYYLGSAAGSQGGVVVTSISALNTLRLRPGDRVLFQGGETFAGTVTLNAEDAGTADRPVVLTSFGNGRATIASGAESAIRIRNAGGIIVRGLQLEGASSASNRGRGIDAEVGRSDDGRLSYLRFQDLLIRRFDHGVWIGGFHTGSTVAYPGFSDVRLENVEVTDVRSEGINLWGTWVAGGNGGRYNHADIMIVRCRVSDAKGDPAADTHTGSGIVVGQADGVLIEHCVAHDNGGRGPATGGGPFGIWAWESNRVTIQHNLVYNQRSPSDVDGGAFDLDGGTTNSVVQYNYSRNNDGPSVAVIQFEGSSATRGNVIRFNISENDNRKAARQGAFYVGDWEGAGPIEGVEVYNNTWYTTATSGGGRPPLVFVESGGRITGINVRNNLLVAGHSGPLLAGPINRPERVRYQGNNYWGGSTELSVLRNGGQERIGSRNLGLRVDPQLEAPGQGGAITRTEELAGLTAYRLRPGSPVANAGLDLQAEFGLEVGARDFYGTAVGSAALPMGAAAIASGEPPPAPPPPLPPPGDGDGGGPGQLLNLSARSRSGTRDDVLIVGWVTEGDTSLLLRAVGPGLQPYGVSDYIANPRLHVFDGRSEEIASNDDWGTLRATVQAAINETKAFPLADRDAALTRRVAGGSWSAMVRGDRQGIALAEIYRLSASSGRLLNLSARAHAGSGSETLIAGFVVGQGGARVLLRALGPTLAQHGVDNPLSDPRLKLFRGDTELARNNNWHETDAAAIRATGFAPPEGSRDAALIRQLEPGSYSAHVESVDGRAGVALVEVYLLQ